MRSLSRKRPIARRALSAQSDQRLVLLFREGHEAAFEEVVRRYQAPLTAFAAAIIPFHRAEDVVQAAFIKAHAALLADSREIALRSWLFTIVRNRALNVIRDDPDWREIDPEHDGVAQPPAIAEQNEELHDLVTAICALPASQREALIGRELEGRGHAELAARLGTTTMAVRGLIFRARTTLRNAVGAAIPIPLLRVLLVEAPAVGAAGAGAATIGGGAKVAATVSVAALALGGGIALDGGKDGGGPAAAAEKPAAVRDSQSGAAPSAAEGARVLLTRAAGDPTGTQAGSGGSGGGGGGQGGSGSDQPGGGHEGGGHGKGTDGGGGHGGGGDNSGGDEGGHGGGKPDHDPGDDDGHEDEGHSGSGGEDDSEEGHSGGGESSGGGGESEHEESDDPEDGEEDEHGSEEPRHSGEGKGAGEESDDGS